MCGRATYKLTWEEIVALYRLTLGPAPHNFQPRFNVCPTTTIDAIVAEDGKRELIRARLNKNWSVAIGVRNHQVEVELTLSNFTN